METRSLIKQAKPKLLLTIRNFLLIGPRARRSVQTSGPFLAFVAMVLTIFASSSRLLATPSRVGAVQVKVALLDGQPVYHWRSFTSSLPNDVDRTLIVQEFERRKYVLPERILNERVDEIIRVQFKGDQNKLVHALALKGAQLGDLRRFLRGEIIINAMLDAETSRWKRPSKPPESQWLASLRKGRHIVALP